MLRPRFKRPPSQPAAQTLTLAAPVGGLNARDALAAMPPTDAVTLDNFFPGTTSVNLRSGSQKWSTGYPVAVESLMAYNNGASSKLFAAAGANIYDATASGAVGAPVVTGKTNARWQHVNISTPGGKFLIVVNGADQMLHYNGTAWVEVSIVTPHSISSISYSGGTATATTSEPHGLSVGTVVSITGATPNIYNGAYVISAVTPTTFSYVMGQYAIASITFVGTTATLTTIYPHGLSTGNNVTVSGAAPSQYNTTANITVTGATTFTYTMGGTPATNATAVGQYVVNQTTASITRVGTTATLTSGTPHNLATGDFILVAGATPAAYNGTYQVTVTGATTLTYLMASDPGASAAPTGTFTKVPGSNASPTGAYTIVLRTVSITFLGATATLTTATPHNLVTNNQVVVSGANPNEYNGTFVITVTSPTTFTYTMSSAPATIATVNGIVTVSPVLTGINPRLLITVTLYANRLFFVEKDTLRAWYLPPNAISGTALLFDLGQLMTLGGTLQTICAWTVDNADGVQEYLCFISTEGEVLMYFGTDPGNAANWSRAGHFYVGRPVGRRCIARWGSDMVIITTDGFVPLSKALLTDRTQLTTAISDKISNLVSFDTGAYFSNFGWQAIFYPSGDKMLVNVPQITNTAQYQYVMNTITGAWCRFVGWKANVFETMGNDLYFGSNVIAGSAYVSKADTGFSDDGAYISGEAKTAFQYFGSPGREKHVTMVKPVFNLTGRMTVTLGIDMDFTDSYPAAQPTFSGSGGTLWNTALWNTFPWSPGTNTKTDWQGLTGIGDAGALHMRIVNNMSSTSWQAVTYVFRLGGVL